MAQAQAAKVRRALAECGVQPGDRVLEIGCGWGALAEMRGARVRRARHRRDAVERAARVRARTPAASGPGRPRRVAAAGLPRDRRRARSTRSSRSRCSRPSAANTGPASSPPCATGSSPAAAPASRSITIRDDLFDRYVQLDRLHPAVHLPRRPAAQPAATSAPRQRKAGLEVVNELDFGADYAETLRRWRESFLAATASCAGSASTPASCASGSSTWRIAKRPSTTGNTDVMQFTLRRSDMNVQRRHALFAAATLLLQGGATGVAAARAEDAAVPTEVADALPGARLPGPGRVALLRPAHLRRAAVGPVRSRSAPTGPTCPSRWSCEYARDLTGSKIAERSLVEMKRQGAFDAARPHRAGCSCSSG